MNYQDFLYSKIDIAPESGFNVRDGEINGALFEWQRKAVRWALKKGKGRCWRDWRKMTRQRRLRRTRE